MLVLCLHRFTYNRRLFYGINYSFVNGTVTPLRVADSDTSCPLPCWSMLTSVYRQKCFKFVKSVLAHRIYETEVSWTLHTSVRSCRMRIRRSFSQRSKCRKCPQSPAFVSEFPSVPTRGNGLLWDYVRVDDEEKARLLRLGTISWDPGSVKRIFRTGPARGIPRLTDGQAYPDCLFRKKGHSVELCDGAIGPMMDAIVQKGPCFTRGHVELAGAVSCWGLVCGGKKIWICATNKVNSIRLINCATEPDRCSSGNVGCKEGSDSSFGGGASAESAQVRPPIIVDCKLIVPFTIAVRRFLSAKYFTVYLLRVRFKIVVNKDGTAALAAGFGITLVFFFSSWLEQAAEFASPVVSVELLLVVVLLQEPLLAVLEHSSALEALEAMDSVLWVQPLAGTCICPAVEERHYKVQQPQ